MKAFDLHRMAFDKVPFDFLGEVALRSLYTFVLVFLFLKMTDKLSGTSSLFNAHSHPAQTSVA